MGNHTQKVKYLGVNLIRYMQLYNRFMKKERIILPVE